MTTSTLAVLASALALASSPQTLTVDPSATVVRFHVHHKMHEVDDECTIEFRLTMRRAG